MNKKEFIQCDCGVVKEVWIYRQQKYCSPICRTKFSRTRISKECPTCHASFDVTLGRTQKSKKNYCSRKCRSQAPKPYLLKQVICNCFVCGKNFSVQKNRGERARFCSKECFKKKWSLKYKNCLNCKSSEFSYGKNGLCIHCYRRTIKYKTIMNRKNHERRIKQKKTDITSQWLLELWNNTTICCICDTEMENHNQYPLGKHLDHILPLNVFPDGHIKSNVRYIHAICNLKRDKLGLDTPLIIEAVNQYIFNHPVI